MRDHEFVGEIEFERRVYRVREGETVLAALLRGGADVASSCRKGSCHTCMLQVTEGDAPAASRARLSPELQAAGAFLPCVAECSGRLVAKRLDLSTTFRSFLVDKKDLLSADVLRLRAKQEHARSRQRKHPEGERTRRLGSKQARRSATIAAQSQGRRHRQIPDPWTRGGAGLPLFQRKDRRLGHQPSGMRIASLTAPLCPTSTPFASLPMLKRCT